MDGRRGRRGSDRALDSGGPKQEPHRRGSRHPRSTPSALDSAWPGMPPSGLDDLVDLGDQAGAPQGQGSADEPQLVLYFVALPDPLPVPNGSTFSLELEEWVPHFQDMVLQPAPGIPPIPGSGSGHSIISIKFWQVRAASDYYLRRIDAVQKVIIAVKGGKLIEPRSCAQQRSPSQRWLPSTPQRSPTPEQAASCNAWSA